jgi:hypothetical protein
MKKTIFLIVVLLGCGPEVVRPPGVTGLEGLSVADLQPRTWLPGTHVVVSGQSFVDPTLGAPRLRLTGTLGGKPIEKEAPATYVDATHVELYVDLDALGGAGVFSGQAVLVFDSLVDGHPHEASPFAAQLTLAQSLLPRLDHTSSVPSFVNDPCAVVGDGFLLGGHEGETRAVVSGCFQAAPTGACAPIGDTEIRATPKTAFDRTLAIFPYSTMLSGIQTGTFTGRVKLRNVLPNGMQMDSQSVPVTWHIQKPMLIAATPGLASLGQYVFFAGGGFVGGQTDELTLLHLEGSYVAEGTTAPKPVSVTLVPEFQDGQTARYTLDELDDLGKLVNLRDGAGHLTGMVTPTIRKGTASLDGNPASIDIQLGHVKQVVWVHFLDSYTDSLRIFGLRAVDDRIRARIFEIAKRDYLGVNIEFRTDPPTDFALYSIVEIGGPDPNDLGLFGYDNTPGKDTGNVRLFDRIGGVNATTQEDGSPGYGGIFAEEFLGFSEHPTSVAQLPLHSPLFDQIFDPFRPDQNGIEVTAKDLENGGPDHVTDGSVCPSTSRKTSLGCAIFVLANLVGTTMTHEVGHSLGLANPYGDGYHDAGDLPNRLMDTGGARPFEERAELKGQGPGVFCDDEYSYLRTMILRGSADPAPQVQRPTCN